MYELVSIHEQARWQKILDLFQISDIYYSSQYFLSAVKLDPGEPFLFYYADEEGEVIYPFIKRKLTDEASPYFDITTPFGYGGPLLKIKQSKTKLAGNFRQAFSNFCGEERIVAEFIRFHPLKKNAFFFENHLKLLPVSETFTIKLTPQLQLSNRTEESDGNGLEPFESDEVVVKKLGTVRHMFEFLVLYYSAARRREEADNYYFFTNDYFETLISSLGPNLHLFGAYYGGELVSACYVLTTGDTIYHHLEGSLADSEKPDSMKSLLLKIAEWGEENYFEFFHLGEDYEGNDQSVNHFKQEISNNEPATFYIGQQIHDALAYNELYSIEDADIIKRYKNS